MSEATQGDVRMDSGDRPLQYQGKASAIARLMAVIGSERQVSVTFLPQGGEQGARCSVRADSEFLDGFVCCGETMEQAAERAIEACLTEMRRHRDHLTERLAAADMRLRQAEEAAR